MFILQNKIICGIDIFYYPVHSLLLREFYWECFDIPPSHPRIHQFLNYWCTDIDAVIHSVSIIEKHPNEIVVKDL